MKSSGNALIYVLIAIILFGALSFAISRSGDSNPQGEISDAAAKAAATSIIAYEAQAKMAVNQMIQNGTKIDDIIFDVPSTSNFNSGETTKKLFHPDGGGLQYKPLPQSIAVSMSSAPNNYYIGKYSNVVWTPTAAQDVLFSAYGINEKVCKELNFRTSGSTVAPTAGSAITRMFVPSWAHGNTNLDITTLNCIGCEDRASACVSFSVSKNVFYSIIYGR